MDSPLAHPLLDSPKGPSIFSPPRSWTFFCHRTGWTFLCHEASGFLPLCYQFVLLRRRNMRFRLSKISPPITLCLSIEVSLVTAVLHFVSIRLLHVSPDCTVHAYPHRRTHIGLANVLDQRYPTVVRVIIRFQLRYPDHWSRLSL